MLFNTWAFALFFVGVWAAYALLAPRWQNRLLLVASYVFYGMWDWRFCGLLMLSTVVDYQVGRRMECVDSDHARKRLLLVSLMANLGVLGVFKYFNFFVESAARLMAVVGLEADAPTLQIVLPVGISFYTFQTLSYTIDVYRRHLSAVRDPIAFGLYVAYFPQLVAGPIERATRLLPQLMNPRRVSADHLASGALLILIGLVRKVIIADNAAAHVDRLFAAPDEYGGLSLLVGVCLFALQIYGDFAGYSDIARGVSRMFGIELMENFRQPYFATSITEFWRRWHISLSSWLRDYLYIPLGGNRGPTWFVYRNLLLTMLLGGLWHGAAWTFVVWGGLHGVALALHKVWMQLGVGQGAGGRLVLLLKPLGWLATTSLVLLAWVFFRAPDFVSAGQYVTGILGWQAGAPVSVSAVQCLFGTMTLLLAIDIPQAVARDQTVMLRWPVPIRGVVYAMLVLVLVVFRPQNDVAFIYFQF